MNFPGEKPKTIEYAYGVASTLNQMVNYIPLKMEIKGIELVNIYNVTLRNEKKNNGQRQKVEENKDWDKNFSSVVKDYEIKPIEIEQEDWLNVASIINQIKNKIEEEYKPIFWNITGGQRPYLMAVWEITKNRPNDIIAYLEGNTGKMVMLKYNKKQELICLTSKKDYKIEGLVIETALNLMGFKPNALPKNILIEPNEKKRLIDFYAKFYPAYLNNQKLRKWMPEFNTNDSGIANFNHIIDNKLPPIAGLTKDEIKVQWDKYKKGKVFGYILEEMLLYLLLKSIEENNMERHISALCHSTKITAGYLSTNKIIDEFDTLILTKTGQIISFEAKSGGMSGDVAKSTNYSTYAISGVYGVPILITPQIDANDIINDKISAAINAAKRANLNIWYLKEIEEKLKNKLIN